MSKKSKKGSYNTVNLPCDIGIYGLRNAIIKQAVMDLRNKYTRFLNEPCDETFYDFRTIRRYFIKEKCDGLVEQFTSDYIFERILGEIHQHYSDEHINNLREKYSY